MEEFGSRQSGISGTQKDQNAISSFHEELANDSKFGSLRLSIFSQAVVHQGIQLNGAVINSKDDPVFKSESFKAALSLFLRISGFVGFCCSVPDTPDYIKHPISNDTLKQTNPENFVSWTSFFHRHCGTIQVFRFSEHFIISQSVVSQPCFTICCY